MANLPLTGIEGIILLENDANGNKKIARTVTRPPGD
jgi:hypothetical protein